MKQLTSAVLSCGFRPFFLASSAYGVVLMLIWLGFWQGMDAISSAYGGPIVWHAHELIYGFGMAAVLGFLTTAVPEFTGKPELQGHRLLNLVFLWGLGRLSYWMSGSWGVLPSVLLNSLLLLVFLAYLVPAVWQEAGGRQRAFVYAIAFFLFIQIGMGTVPEAVVAPMRWMNAAVGVLMILIIVALSRISMRAINGLEEGIDLHNEAVEYLARPPRRNLATFTIAFYTTLEFFVPTNAITGWVGLAAAAAMLNLLNDWHIGRVLFNRWVFAMYSIYWSMAIGYALLGYAILFDLTWISAARHFLLIGGVGLSVLLVQLFAGQVHCGFALSYRPWMTVAILALPLAMSARFLMIIFAHEYSNLLLIAGILWVLAFALYFSRFALLLISPSADGRKGC